MRVFVTGGTGLVGSLLVKKLLERGDSVVLLTRRPETARDLGNDRCTIVTGDPTQEGPWMEAVRDCDAVVHLAGEGIFKRRWNQAFKELLYESRIKSTNHIVASLARQPHTSSGQPKVLVNASAIGFYGPHGDEELTEESAPAHDFLARICIDWEKAAQAATTHGIRVVMIRIGIVLGKEGSALQKMLTPFKMFIGGPIGNGQQYMSWIHIDDLCGLILYALDHAKIQGPMNGTAPHPATNSIFSRTLGKVLGRPSFLMTPKFVLKLMLGESGQLVTEGQKVMPRRAQSEGYTFKFPDLETALRDLLGR